MKPKRYNSPGQRERHLASVRKGSNVRHTTRSILLQMLLASDFKEATVTITKKQIAEEQMCDRKTVQRAWDNLKSEGTIVPYKNRLGGRGNATSFILTTSDMPPPGEAEVNSPAEHATALRDRLMALMGEGNDYGTARIIMEKEGFKF